MHSDPIFLHLDYEKALVNAVKNQFKKSHRAVYAVLFDKERSKSVQPVQGRYQEIKCILFPVKLPGAFLKVDFGLFIPQK